MSKTFVNINFILKSGGYSLSLYNPATNSATGFYTYPNTITIGIPANGDKIDWNPLIKGKNEARVVVFYRYYRSHVVDWSIFMKKTAIYIGNERINKNPFYYNKNFNRDNINIDIVGVVGNGSKDYPDYNSFYIIPKSNHMYVYNNIKKLSYSKFGKMSSDNLWNYYWIIFAVVALFFFLKKQRK